MAPYLKKAWQWLNLRPRGKTKVRLAATRIVRRRVHVADEPLESLTMCNTLASVKNVSPIFGCRGTSVATAFRFFEYMLSDMPGQVQPHLVNWQAKDITFRY